MKGDERKALIVADLRDNVDSAIDWEGRSSPWLEAQAAVLGDALEEYGYPTLSNEFREWFDIYMRGNTWAGGAAHSRWRLGNVFRTASRTGELQKYLQAARRRQQRR